jgi:hypothetical protein
VARPLTQELQVGRIDSDAHPVRVRPSEGFDAREVLEQTVRLLAVKRLVDPEQMSVTVEKGHRLVEGLQLV